MSPPAVLALFAGDVLVAGWVGPSGSFRAGSAGGVVDWFGSFYLWGGWIRKTHFPTTPACAHGPDADVITTTMFAVL